MRAARFGIGTLRVADMNLAFALLTTLLIAGLVRFLPVSTSVYPLNDGALFARMAADLARNGFALPAFTTYNGEAIPFVYPPLGIYLISGLAQVVGNDTITVIRWLPAALSTASVMALYLMAAELLRSRWRGVMAAAAFALMPRSYEWLIVGGGITRSLGLLLALLALQQGLRILSTQRTVSVLSTAVLGGLTLLAHPQAAAFLAASILILVGFHLFHGGAMAAVRQVALAGLGGLVVAAPWLLTVVASHGIEPLLSAGRSALDPTAGAGQLLGLAFTETPVLDLMTALGVVGVVIQIARGQWMIPLWLVVTVVIDPRAGTTYATVPLALAVALMLGELMRSMSAAHGGSFVLESEPIPRLIRTHRVASVTLALLLFLTLRTAARTAVDPVGPVHGLQEDHITAMEWIRTNADHAARFAVVTGRTWDSDYLGEWFPVLANRTSVATVQGSEWTGIDSFLERLAMDRQLQDCATRTETCLASWVSGWNQDGDYLFLPKGQLFGPSSPADCCPALRESLLPSADYRVVYDGPGATIFAPRDR